MAAALDDLMTVISGFFRTILLHVIICSVLALHEGEQAIDLPDDIIQEYIEDVIDRYDLHSVLGRKRRANDTQVNVPKKRQMIQYDRQRALQNVMADWMGPVPIFPDKQFERTFRLRRSFVDPMLNNLAHHDSFWTITVNAAGRESISPLVKFLTAQKLICYGVSFSAFRDYYQMGESTARLCMSKLCRGIVECDAISEFYLRYPSKHDARRITALHKRLHGVPGMMGSLDVTKVIWTSCPTAWRGQFEGKEGIPTISLEAVASADLWIWHSAFGFPGTLNDLNIWDQSPLFASMIDGTHDELDFPFYIGGQEFNRLFYLVDGIYPLLARFLPSVKDPTTAVSKHFATLQEAWRKAVERAFGVWKKKFQAIGNKVTLEKRDDIFYLVKATIVMHNMMVEARNADDEVESDSFYETAAPNTSVADGSDGAAGEDNGNGNDMDVDIDSSRTTDLGTYRIVRRRWDELYDAEEAFRLQDAVKRQLWIHEHGDDGRFDTDDMYDGYDPLSF